MPMNPYEDYKSVSVTQAGAGTAEIIAAPAAGYVYEIAYLAWEVVVVNAGGTWTVQEATPVVLAAGSCISLHTNSMPVGDFSVPATKALNLVVGTGGTVVVHVLYKQIRLV